MPSITASRLTPRSVAAAPTTPVRRSVVAIAPDAGERLWFLNQLVVVKLRGPDAPWGVLETELESDNCTPFHRHHGEDEAFYVLQGELSLYVEGGQILHGSPGSYVHIPRGVAHGFRTHTHVKLLVLSSPTGFVDFTRAYGVHAAGPGMPPPLERAGRGAPESAAPNPALGGAAAPPAPPGALDRAPSSEPRLIYRASKPWPESTKSRCWDPCPRSDSREPGWTCLESPKCPSDPKFRNRPRNRGHDGSMAIRSSVLPGLVLLASACSSPANAPVQPGGGGQPAASGGSGGVPGITGGSAGSAGTTATGGGGAAALGGTGGAPASASAGNGGMAGGAGTAGAPVGGAGGQSAGGSVGVQADPGATGDGKTTQNAPYSEPPEVTGLQNGAPAGLLNGLPPGMPGATTPKLYASPARYPGYKFHYWIWVPAQYQPGKPAALMVFQDGPHYLGITDSHFHTPTVFANLIHAGEMPVTIAVFTEAGTPDGNFNFDAQRLIREKEYSEYSDVFARFLLDELIPNVVSNQYDLVQDADGWAIGGQSSGGNCSLIVGMHESSKFHKILTHNGAFDNADLQTSDYMNNGHPVFPTVIANGPALPLRINLLSGPNDIAITYQANQAVVAALAAKGYHYRYVEGSGMHYPPIHAVADYPAALRWLWRGYSLPWYQ